MVKITRIERIQGHPWVRAVAEVDWHGVRLRGLKLEEHPQGWRLTPPGRKIQGQWQTLFTIQDPELERKLLEQLRHHG